MKYQGTISELKMNGSIANFVLHVTGGPDVRVQTSVPLPAGTKAGDVVQVEGAETNDPPFIATALWKVNVPQPKPLPWKLIAIGAGALVLLIVVVLVATHLMGGSYYTLEMKETSTFLSSADCASSVSLQASPSSPDSECAAWRFIPDKKYPEYMRIQLKKNKLYLTMPGCASPAILSSTVTGTNSDCQLWRFAPLTANNSVPSSTDWSKLQSRHLGQFLDASYCQPTFGLNPGSTYHGGACELFLIKPAP